MFIDLDAIPVFTCRKCNKNYCTSCMKEHDPEIYTCEEYVNVLNNDQMRLYFGGLVNSLFI